jgi:hypothetical protein
MDSAQISRLSPAEKLDILAGNQNFQITNHELRFRGPPATPQHWEGFCNGIRAAGALTPEPRRSVRRLSPNGTPIVFETTDIKAILGAAFFFLGERNNYAYIGDNRTTVDPNPGAFDIALRMLLGGSDRVFFMDVAPGTQIFNHTIVGYDRKLVRRSPPRRDGSRSLTFETTVHHMGELSLYQMGRETSSRVAALDPDFISTHRYSYELTVDRNRRIIDGRWIESPGSPRNWPDAVWFGSGQGDDRNHTPFTQQGIENNWKGNPHLTYDLLMELLRESAGTT